MTYGGKAQYVKWGKATGLNLTSDYDFFSHPTLRSYYKAHAVLNRVNIHSRTYPTRMTLQYLLGIMGITGHGSLCEEHGCKALGRRLDWRDFTVHRTPDRAQFKSEFICYHKLELTLSGTIRFLVLIFVLFKIMQTTVMGWELNIEDC
ncbi:hypothetical protein NC652_015205 [Populus alba x Populus x berolinensis]|nr:hypothetical protein NC652_015205 [Populus alba x Populus x berolinensis]